MIQFQLVLIMISQHPSARLHNDNKKKDNVNSLHVYKQERTLHFARSITFNSDQAACVINASDNQPVMSATLMNERRPWALSNEVSAYVALRASSTGAERSAVIHALGLLLNPSGRTPAGHSFACHC